MSQQHNNCCVSIEQDQGGAHHQGPSAHHHYRDPKHSKSLLNNLKSGINETSPPSVIITEAESRREQQRKHRGRIRCRPRWVDPDTASLGCNTFLLVAAATGERVGFKISIDQMEPFRLFLALLVVLCTVLSSATVVLYKKLYTHEITRAMHHFPRKDILLIAFLDTLQLYVMVVAGSSTPPVLSVLLMQTTLPLAMVLSKVTAGPQRLYTWQHWVAAGVISGGLAVAVVPTVVFAWKAGDQEIAINTLAFLLTGVPAAISQIVKERAIVEFSQPMNMYYLNLLLAIYQFIMLLILSPLAYRLQGLGRGWSAYGRADVGAAFMDWMLCLFTERGAGIDHEKYPVEPQCHYAFAATTAYVVCTPLVTVAVNGVLQFGNTTVVLYRGLNAAMTVAFVILAGYSAHSWGWFSPGMNVFDVLGLVLVLFGLELFHKQAEPDAEVWMC